MRKIIWKSALLAAVLACVLRVQAQSEFRLASADLAATYATSRAKVSNADCCFWFQGAGANVSFTLYRGWGLAGDVASSATARSRPAPD